MGWPCRDAVVIVIIITSIISLHLRSDLVVYPCGLLCCNVIAAKVHHSWLLKDDRILGILVLSARFR
jgi:hypothetical protein